jgi:hypothetical protein
MNPNEFGKKLGIGVRVAGRIAQQKMDGPAQPSQPGASHRPAQPQPQQSFIPRAREKTANAHQITRAAGRGLGGFLRPFGRLGGILWLEVTGFFFGLFALYFAQDIWRTRLSYATGEQHQRFLIAVALTVVFGYLSISAFWRAKRK